MYVACSPVYAAGTESNMLPGIPTSPLPPKVCVFTAMLLENRLSKELSRLGIVFGKPDADAGNI